MRNSAVLAVGLVLAASAGAAPMPEALLVPGFTELYLVHESGTVSASIRGVVTSAAWSPDGTRFAYLDQSAGHGRLFVAAADGSGTREVPQRGLDGGWTGPVVWVSPDEVALHHRAPTASFYTLWIVPVNGSDPRLLAQPADLNFPPAMQPNGFLLLYSVQSSNGVLRRAVVDVRSGASTLLPMAASLAWSPDGRLLASPSSDGIETLRPDGTGRRAVLSDLPAATNFPVQELGWSPDGSRIVFTKRTEFPELRDRSGVPTRFDVYSVAVDGSDLRRLTGVAGDRLWEGFSNGSLAPAWWPDSSRLFLRRAGFGQDRTLMMNADGTCETPWPGPATSAYPLWRPGAITSGRMDCSSVIVRLRASLGEVSYRAALPLTVALRNDGTRTLRDVRLSLAATRGTLVVPGRACGAGGQVVCALGDLEPGSEVAFGARAIFRAPGQTRVTASASYAGGADADPTDDLAAALADVSPCDLLGTWGRDRLVGTRRGEWICARPGWDYIDARGGNDIIDAGSGVDTVIAGAGRDVVDSGGGGDTIRVRDGERDVVDCGTETDVVFADRKDVLRHCEKVQRR